MDDQHLALVRAVHQKEIDRLRALGQLRPAEPKLIPHAELPELPRDHELYREWNTYRREIGALLAAGCEYSWVLIAGETIMGLYGRWEHAYIAALEKALLMELQPPFLIHQILSDDDLSRIEKLRTPWPQSRFPLAQTA